MYRTLSSYYINVPEISMHSPYGILHTFTLDNTFVNIGLIYVPPTLIESFFNEDE